ncbi:hypothetical protein M231_04581 [Tremella mesenterica]|uniref:Uncharacterized protein n=1 Tax=Tremella mesenterica TaxID=5217 RepID=A0A4Q1BKF2_TREME|nr:hypothetical protein M231_04581 [Tremella mesenterica]
MTLTLGPLYCCLCASPCLLPRYNTPLPQDQAVSTDTTTSTPLHPDWLRDWHYLQVSSGLIQPPVTLSSPVVGMNNLRLSTPRSPLPPRTSETQQIVNGPGPQSVSNTQPALDVLQELSDQEEQDTGSDLPNREAGFEQEGRTRTGSRVADVNDFPSRAASPSPPTRTPHEAHRRTVPIHAYCLMCVLRTVRKTMYGGYSHEERMMLGWSLPKWTGHGSWVGQVDPNVFGGEKGLGVGYWCGTKSQRERWKKNDGKEGGHLVNADLQSPLSLNLPSHRPSPSSKRPSQSSSFALLPQTILLEIISYLLPSPTSSEEHDNLRLPQKHDTILDRVTTDSNVSTEKKLKRDQPSHLLSPQCLNDLLSLRRTCSAMRYLPLPRAMWEMIILDDVRQWTLGLLRRWKANPSGVGSATQLWIALEEEIEQPVKVVLASVEWSKRSDQVSCNPDSPAGDETNVIRVQSEEKIILESGTSGTGVKSVMTWTDKGLKDSLNEFNRKSDNSGYDLEDVWNWWAYSDAWRSRRRIWYCVVHASATARDADWWWMDLGRQYNW